MNGQLEDTANNDSIILKTVLKNQPNYINQYSIIERFQTRIHFDYADPSIGGNEWPNFIFVSYIWSIFWSNNKRS